MKNILKTLNKFETVVVSGGFNLKRELSNAADAVGDVDLEEEINNAAKFIGEHIAETNNFIDQNSKNIGKVIKNATSTYQEARNKKRDNL